MTDEPKIDQPEQKISIQLSKTELSLFYNKLKEDENTILAQKVGLGMANLKLIEDIEEVWNANQEYERKIAEKKEQELRLAESKKRPI